jgi:hypothetical protein
MVSRPAVKTTKEKNRTLREKGAVLNFVAGGTELLLGRWRGLILRWSRSWRWLVSGR